MPEVKDHHTNITSTRHNGDPHSHTDSAAAVCQLKTDQEGNESNLPSTSKEVVLAQQPSVPDGGTKAWLQAVGGAFLFFNSWGLIYSYGSYQAYYESGALFTSSSSNISWIGSVQSYIMYIFALITGPIYDAGYFRELIYVGCVISFFGQMMLSLCDKQWQAILAQGFVMGLGFGCFSVPILAHMATYFSTKLALATGLVVSGASFGGVIYPIVFHKLIDSIGFGWTNRIIGFIMLATYIPPIFLIRVRAVPPPVRRLVDFRALLEPAFGLMVTAIFSGSLGVFVVYFYINYYSIDKHITDENLGYYMLVVVNASACFGRLIPGALAVKYGNINVFSIVTLLTGTFTVAMIGVHSLAAVVTIALLYGFTTGAVGSLSAPAYITVTPDKSTVGTRLGMAFSISLLGALIGTPIAGAMLQNYGWNALWIWAGVTLFIGFIFILAAKHKFTGGKILTKC